MGSTPTPPSNNRTWNMKVAQIKTQRQFTVQDWRQYHIQSYGESNDFPQSVDEIVTASKTGNACLGIYNDFIYGQGFRDEEVGKIVVNSKGHSLNKVLRMVAKDFAKWHGFAIHVNYNANLKVSSVSHIPFETLRLHTPDECGNVTTVAYHPDWGRRDKLRRTWKASDIEWFNLFNPDPDVVLGQVNAAGGWDQYKGQILYVSGDSEGIPTYPLPLYIAEVTDMRTEEGLANVTGRNVCSNFLAAGILVDIKDEEQSDQQVQEKQLELEAFQGDENTSQLWYTQVRNKEQIPSFIPFTGTNYDKSFTATQAAVPENIGQAFKQPPILRAVNVGAGFGADLMTNAYKFYNSVTTRERQQLSEGFELLFAYWWAPLTEPDFTIQPLTYNGGESIADRLGKDNMTQVLEVLRDQSLSLTQKRNMLKFAFGLYDDEITKILPNDT